MKNKKTKLWTSAWREKVSKQIRKCNILSVCLFVLFCMVGTISFSGNVCYVKAADEQEETKETQFDIQATFGFDNVAQVGRSMLANITVTNHGEDFSGLVQILIPITAANNEMYQNDISIAKGETKSISMPLHMSNYTEKMIVSITDQKENVITKKRVKVDLVISEDLAKVVGILTDNKDVLGYWEEEDEKIVYLSKEDMPEQEAGLEPLDVLIINDFDTQNLNKKQYESLKDWVSKGGNLVIGTGVNANRTLGIFEDDFLTGSFGVAGKVGEVEFTMDRASVYEDEKNDISMQQVKKDLGCICLFTKDLGVEYTNWKKQGTAFKDMVYGNINLRKIESTIYSDDDTGLETTDQVKMPSVKRYAIVFFIYVVVVSWILYFVLRRKDKLEWTWGFVPALALLFALVVYGMGGDTRITEPYITYAKLIEWSGEGEKTGKGSTRMMITSPYNEKYSITAPKGVTVSSGKDNANNYQEAETDFNDYKIGFRQSGDQQMITFHDFAAFESATIKAEEVVSMKGSYEAEVTCDQYEFNGTFTNRTGKKIRNAVFTSDGRFYKLGTIKDGETVKISNKCKNVVVPSKVEFDHMFYDFSEVQIVLGIPNYIDYEEKETLEVRRYEDALFHYLIQSGTQEYMQGKVIGIMDDSGMDEEMTESWGMDSSGITIETFPVDVNYTNQDGETFVPDLATYGTVTGDAELAERYIYGEEILVEYSLKKNETLTGLYYLSSVNDEFTKFGGKGLVVLHSINCDEFEGEIYAYNYETKKYEKIFDGDKAGKIKDVKRFVGEKNKLLLKIKPKSSGDYTIPIISATKKQK